MKSAIAFLVCMLSIFSIWNCVYAAAQSSNGQLVLLEDATSGILGDTAELLPCASDLHGQDRSVKRQRTMQSSVSIRAAFAPMPSEQKDESGTITLLREALEKSYADKRETDERMHEMSQAIALLQGKVDCSIEAIKQLSSHTVLFMGTSACDPTSMQQVAVLHIKQLRALAVPVDDDAIQVICLATAKRFCDELSKCSYEERSSFIVCASTWLSKINRDKLPERLQPNYEELLRKIPREIPLPSLSIDFGLF